MRLEGLIKMADLGNPSEICSSVGSNTHPYPPPILPPPIHRSRPLPIQYIRRSSRRGCLIWTISNSYSGVSLLHAGIFTDPVMDQQFALMSGLEAGEPVSRQRKCKSEDDGPPIRLRRSSGSIGTAHVMAQTMGRMGDSFVMGQAVRVGSASVNGPNPYTIKECQVLLEEIDDPSFDDDLYYLAQEQFRDPVSRELFCTQANSGRRLTWLKKKKAKEEKAEYMQNMLFK